MRLLLPFLFLSPDIEGGASAAPATPAPATPAAPAPAAEAPAAPAAPVTPALATPPAVPAEPSLEDSLLAFGRHHSEDQPRDEAGRFAEGQGEPAAAPAVPAEVETPNADGNAEPTPEPPEGAEPTPDGVEGEPPVAERVALPARNAGEPEVEIEVDDPAVAERLRQLKNGFLRGEGVRAAQADVAAARAELDQVQDQIVTDPVGFVHTNLSPELRRELAMQILADPDVLASVAPEVEALLDPERSDIVRSRLETRRYQLREVLREQHEQRTRTQAQVQQIRRAVEALVPEGWDEERAALFTTDCLADLGRWVRTVGAAAVEPAQVPVALAARLRSVGIDPVQAADAMHQRLAGAGSGDAPRATARPTPPAAPQRPVAKARPAQPTGQDFVAGRERRRAAAAVVPAGAIAPAAGGLDVPPDATLDDVFDLLRKA